MEIFSLVYSVCCFCMVCFCSMFNRLIYRVLSTSFSICCWAVLLSWSSLSQHLIYPNRFRFIWVCWFSQCNCWYFQCIVAITQDFCCSWWRLVTMWFLIDICSLEFYTPVSGHAITQLSMLGVLINDDKLSNAPMVSFI